jgi:Ser/Thr protein kinase RdoA (MazF antagonist)
MLAHFGLPPGRPQPDSPEHPLPGSPERCLARWALQDARGGRWMLERLAPGQGTRRQELAGLLAELSRLDPALARVIPAYRSLPERPNNYVLTEDGGQWQLSPFVPGVPLPRPGYLDHTWRGEAVAAFLLALQTAGAQLSTLPTPPQEDLIAYRDGLFAAISRKAPELLPRLALYRAALAELPDWLASVPPALAHGDLHPLNIIWGESDIRCVIDWEFAGARHGLYDAAGCLGCAGFEHPSAFSRGFVLGLLKGLRQNGLTTAQVHLLPRLVLASRLGWLSEWLRKGDAEMLDMELDYLDILLDELDGLGRFWAKA